MSEREIRPPMQDVKAVFKCPDHPVLSARDLVVHRGTARVLNDVSLDLRPGDTLAIQGPSGGGKSTLLAVLCGLLLPTGGTVEIKGECISDRSDRVRSRLRLRSMGVIFQGDEFLPELTIAENVSLPLRLGKPTSTTRSLGRVVSPLLERLGIGDIGARFPSEVSGGQLQRAAVARSIVHGPAVVLADEPTGSLDEASSRDAMTLLLDMASEKGAAVVVITHDDDVAARCSMHEILRRGELSPGRARPPETARA